MQQYDSYKDSGVQWLGEIPNHWEIKPGRTIFSENKMKNTALAEEVVLSLSYGKIIEKQNKNDGLVPEEYSSYQIIEPGFIIVRCTDLQNDHVSLRTAISELHGIITSAYLALIPNNSICPKYFHYFFRNWDNTKELYRYGSGLRQSLSWNDFKYLLCVLPPLSEQSAIAAYLDEQTAKIDTAIAQQQKMIELLNERKQIIINNAVTKGLNPNAKMKPSGIDWIGNIPEHWEVRKLKQIAKLRSGDTISSDQFTTSGFPVFGGNGFRGYTDRYTNEGNYVLIGRQGALCGNVNYADGKFFASEHAVVVYPHSAENVIWLGECIKASNLNQYSQSAAQPGLAVSVIGNVSYPYPPTEERDAIAEYIRQNTERLDCSINNATKQITLLQERKQIIINNVVTGKVKIL